MVCDVSYDKHIEDMWPFIFSIKEKFDLALIDLPLYYPRFHTNQIPYKTQPLQDFLKFKYVLDK